MKSKPRAAVAAIIVLWASAATAQNVVLDGSLRPGNQGLVPFAPPPSPYTYLIDQNLGIRAGPNLFHSFESFSLDRDEIAHFSGTPGIENLIARVTGNQRSTIAGVISADPDIATSGFYLLNPRGITFVGDPDEQLSHLAIPGSFYGSTADRLLFDAGRFESDGVGGTPVAQLDVAPTGWGFDAGFGGDILIDNALPLAVENGQVLSLIAGEVVVTRTAKVEAFEGAIEIAAVGDQAGEVPLALAGYDAAGEGLGEIRFEQDALVRAGDGLSGLDQGQVVIRGGRLVIDDSLVQVGGNAGPGSRALDVDVTADVRIRNTGKIQLTRRDTTGLGDSRIEANQIEIDGGGSWIFASVSGGDAATPQAAVELAAPDIRIQNGGLLFSDSRDGGDGADLVVQAERLDISSGGRVASRTTGSGQGGAILLSGLAGSRAASLDITQAGSLTTETQGMGRGGDLIVEADRVRVSDAASVISSTSGTGALDPGGSGPGDTDPSDNPSGGDVRIQGESLRIENGGQIEAVTLSGFAGGHLAIEVDSVSIQGGPGIGPETGLFATSGRSLAEPAAGDSGGLEIRAKRLEMSGARAAVSTRTYGAGDAGILEVEASESVVLRGDAAGAPVLIASAFGGDGGGVAAGEPSLRIETGRLELLDGAGVLSSALSSGNAGDIEIEADDVVIQGRSGSRRSTILSEAADDSSLAGDGGRIRLKLVGDLELSDEGRISVITRGPGTSGGVEIEAGGDIEIASGAAVTSDAEVGRASPEPEAAGDLSLRAEGEVRLIDGSVRARGFGAVDAGGIAIEAGRKLVVRRGAITSEAVDAAGGNIRIQARKQVDLRDASITTSVRGAEDIVDAGNIDIDPQFVVLNDSAILANAILGRGGNIRIVTDQLVRSAESRIDASSAVGIDGNVVVTAPENQLLNGLSRLPAEFLDASRLLGARCADPDRAQGSFVLAGRSGLPPSPTRPLSVSMPLPDAPLSGADRDAREAANRSGARNLALWAGPTPCPREGDAGEARP